MKKIVLVFCSAFVIASCTDKKEIPAIQPKAPVVDQDWQFETTPMWQDDFSVDGMPDASKWSFEEGGNGWGNNELQYYTSGDNASVADGKLIIQAKKENVLGRQYSSARMITRGRGDWKFGRYEIRAKLPKGRGTWPAIWMLPSDNIYGVWPSSGEIDIMEHVGFEPNKVHASIHCSSYNGQRGNQKTASKLVNNPAAIADYHIYRIDWTPYAIKGFIDGEQYFEYINDNTSFTTWPFDQKFYLLLNIAVGGNWGGAQGVDDNAFPATMEVDYVKVYKMIE